MKIRLLKSMRVTEVGKTVLPKDHECEVSDKTGKIYVRKGAAKQIKEFTANIEVVIDQDAAEALKNDQDQLTADQDEFNKTVEDAKTEIEAGLEELATGNEQLTTDQAALKVDQDTLIDAQKKLADDIKAFEAANKPAKKK